MRIRGIPIINALIGVLGLLMLVVALFAVASGEWHAAQEFGLWGGVTLTAAAGLIPLLNNQLQFGVAKREAVTLLFIWLGLPLIATLPLLSLLPELGLRGTYFEMVSGLTTTGATVIDDVGAQDRAVLLWRSLMQWLGGVLTLLTVLVVLAPRRLGPFDVVDFTGALGRRKTPTAAPDSSESSWAVEQATLRVMPYYSALTMILVIAYWAAGMSPFHAINYAMTTISTGGFAPHTDGIARFESWPIEFVALGGMILGATGIGVIENVIRRRRGTTWSQAEVRAFVIVVVVAVSIPMVRHLLTAHTIGELGNWLAVIKTFWGELFQVVSFLSTTGFGSDYGDAGIAWSGLSPPIVILLGLVAIGGGVASTAGGIRLLRISLLTEHAFSELRHILQPERSTVMTSHTGRAKDVRLAWLSAMLFALAASAGMLIVALWGLNFENSMGVTIASLSNVGPLLPLVVDDPRSWAKLPAEVQLACCLLMALGRIGVLSAVALLHSR